MDNAFKFFRKLNAKEEEEVLNEAGVSLPRGYVTDGRGSIYKVPDEGKTPMFAAKGTPDRVRFVYNFETRKLEVWTVTEKDQPRELLTSYGLSAGDFADGPEYWAGVAFSTVEDEITHELENERMAESIASVQESWKQSGFGLDD